MHIDVPMAFGGLIVGVVVGLTGMGGGALMTPMLMVVFGVQPLAAVSSDLVASAVMKPVGSLVHLRRGTVHLGVVKWLCLGSVPSAFCGVLITRALGDGDGVQEVVKLAMGVALLVAATMMVVKAYLGLRSSTRAAAGGAAPEGVLVADDPVVVRPLPTVLVGIVGGLIVGMTSVGSGSLIIVALLMMYPLLPAAKLVGTDLVQAVPLVAAAAAGHLLFGDFQFSVTLSLLIGCVPGAYIGARLSSRAPSGIIRWALAVVLVASGLKMFDLGALWIGGITLAVAVLGVLGWITVRRMHGLPMVSRAERSRAPTH